MKISWLVSVESAVRLIGNGQGAPSQWRVGAARLAETIMWLAGVPLALAQVLCGHDSVTTSKHAGAGSWPRTGSRSASEVRLRSKQIRGSPGRLPTEISDSKT